MSEQKKDMNIVTKYKIQEADRYYLGMAINNAAVLAASFRIGLAIQRQSK